MDILSSHLGYILATLAIGAIAGYRAYPLLNRLRAKANRLRKGQV